MQQNIDDVRTGGRPLDGERCEGQLTSFLSPQSPLVRYDRLYPGRKTVRSFQQSPPDQRKFRERLAVVVDN